MVDGYEKYVTMKKEAERLTELMNSAQERTHRYLLKLAKATVPDGLYVQEIEANIYVCPAPEYVQGKLIIGVPTKLPASIGIMKNLKNEISYIACYRRRKKAVYLNSFFVFRNGEWKEVQAYVVHY